MIHLDIAGNRQSWINLCCSKPIQLQTRRNLKCSIATWKKSMFFLILSLGNMFDILRNIQGWISIAIWVCSSFYQNIVKPSLYMFLKFIHRQFCPFMPTLKSSILPIFVTWLGYEKSQVVKSSCRFCLTCFWETLNSGHLYDQPKQCTYYKEKSPSKLPATNLHQLWSPLQKRGGI